MKKVIDTTSMLFRSWTTQAPYSAIYEEDICCVLSLPPPPKKIGTLLYRHMQEAFLRRPSGRGFGRTLQLEIWVWGEACEEDEEIINAFQ